MQQIDFIVLDKAEAKEKIGIIDNYLLAMKPFERSLKMGVGEDITLEKFVDFLKENVCEWNEEEKAKVSYSIDKLKASLDKLNITAPNKIYIIKTSGKDEWNSAYTRDNIIILPQKKLSKYDNVALFELLTHEFFHVYSRFNENKRNQLYGLLGFKALKEDYIPREIKELSLINPDALQEVYTEINYKNKTVKVSPLIMIKNKNVDDAKDILESIRIKLYIIDTNETADAEEAAEYIEKISVNTNNIQHPEEVLAENFTFLVTDKQDVTNKNFLSEIEKIIRTQK